MDQLDAWSEFNVAMVGATAALAGLVIVASSVNIAEIIKSATLSARLAAAIASLVLAIVVTGMGLVPDIGSIAYGAVIAGLAADVVRIAVMTYFIGRRGSPRAEDGGDVRASTASPRVAEARR